jgi:pantoate--beta-alanine ligase
MAFRSHGDPVGAARAVLSGHPGVDIDYVAVADFEGQPTLAIAARVGRTRLIDNVPLDLDSLPEMDIMQGLSR